ncbi:heavy metal-binding domain-containing protein, partial [Acinetobacter baumannii]
MEHNHHNQQLYTCPMHPEIVKNEPGSCPKCGMSLVAVNAKEEEHSPSPHQ